MSSDAPGEEASDSFVERLRRGERTVRTRPDTGAAGGRPAEGRRLPATPHLDESCPVTAAIRDADGLGRLGHVGPALDRRFGTERRLRTAGEPARLDVRAFRPPVDPGDGFVDALRGQVHRWATVGDVEGVVPVVDRGVADRPWVATERVGPALSGRETPTLERALRHAIHLAGALVAVHDRGVVHAGIDPGNVAVALDRDGPPRPALHNLGLVDVYRRYEDPVAVLDPRYAAPELFADERGVVDRATDVYGLGVLTYRLVTGTPPVSGGPEAIADRVTGDDPFPRPSRLEPRAPTALDAVLLRATATEKFARYDTARDLRDALRDVLDVLPVGGESKAF